MSNGGAVLSRTGVRRPGDAIDRETRWADVSGLTIGAFGLIVHFRQSHRINISHLAANAEVVCLIVRNYRPDLFASQNVP
jgi:hypothetical protein